MAIEETHPALHASPRTGAGRRLWLASAWARYTRPGKGVEGVYNRHDDFAERRRALAAWGQLLLKLERGDATAKTGTAKAP